MSKRVLPKALRQRLAKEEVAQQEACEAFLMAASPSRVPLETRGVRLLCVQALKVGFEQGYVRVEATLLPLDESVELSLLSALRERLRALLEDPESRVMDRMVQVRMGFVGDSDAPEVVPRLAFTVSYPRVAPEAFATLLAALVERLPFCARMNPEPVEETAKLRPLI